ADRSWRPALAAGDRRLLVHAVRGSGRRGDLRPGLPAHHGLRSVGRAAHGPQSQRTVATRPRRGGLGRHRCDQPGGVGRDDLEIGLGVLLWLLVIDVFLFTQSAGPGVAAICALACLPTTAFGLLVVRRMDRNHKEPWRLVLVAAAWGAIVATSLVVWGETIWEGSAQHALVPGPGLDTSLAFMAGILEEIAKGLAVLLLFLVMRNEFDD